MQGLDPAERLKQKKEAAANQPPPRLEPLFPFTPTQFDPWFFNLQNDPPPPKKKVL